MSVESVKYASVNCSFVAVINYMWMWKLLIIMVIVWPIIAGVPPGSRLRFLTVKFIRLRLQCLKACYLCLFPLENAATLLACRATRCKLRIHLRYLYLKRFIVHKFKGGERPNIRS